MVHWEENCVSLVSIFNKKHLKQQQTIETAKTESTGLSTLEVLSAVWIKMEISLDCAQLRA